MATTDNEITVEEAQAVLDAEADRVAAEAAAAEAERLAPLRDLCHCPEMVVVREKLDALPPQYLTDPDYGAHVMALRTGLTQLCRAVPPAPEAPAEETAE